jgi:hypothetical protein
MREFDSMYQGKRPFTREQLVFVIESGLAAAMDLIESDLPSAGVTLEERRHLVNQADWNPENLDPYACGCLETAGMFLAIVYAQLTGDGLSPYDALECSKIADVPFHRMVEEWVRDSVRTGRNTAATPEHPDRCVPDARPWAEAFVTATKRQEKWG